VPIQLKSIFSLIIFTLIANSAFAEVKPADGDSKELTPTQLYIKIEPPFVVNVDDGETLRFLQVNTELQFSDALAQPIIEKHMPAIRHAMIMLLSGQPAKEIKTPKGKETLRMAALEKVQKVMTDNTERPVVEAIYFTGFIIQ